MSSIDILGKKYHRVNREIPTGKSEMLGFGMVEGRHDYSKDVDLLAKHLTDFEQTPKWKSDTELGIDLGRYGWLVIKAAERASVAELAVEATLFGITGGLMLAWGIAITTIGIMELIQNTMNNPIGNVPYHLIVPGRLDLRDSDNQARTKEKYSLLDKEEIDDFFEKMSQSLNETMDSVHELSSSFKEGRENRMGELAERGVVETESHLTENRPALSERR